MRSIELIELGLNEIARECRIIDDVATEGLWMGSLKATQGIKPENIAILKRITERHQMMLKEVHEKVRDLLEFVGEYMNGQDMVSAVDVAINKTIYDLVYERTSDGDYEEKEAK